MKNLIRVTFLLICFLSFSQDYELDVIFEKLDNKSYKIKNYSNKTIGFLRFNSINKKEFRYFNINDELVGKESLNEVYRDGISLFDLKTTNEVLNSSGKPIHIRFWDEEQGRFNIFLDGEEIGYLKNNKLKKQWEYFKNTYLEIDAYANIFKINPNTESIIAKSMKKTIVNNNNYTNKYNTPINKNKSNNSTRTVNNRNRTVNNRNSSFLFSDVNGAFYIGVDKLYLDKSNDFTIANEKGFGITPEYKFELGFFTDATNLYFGIQFANQKSNTKTEYDDLNDQIWALGFGFGLFRDKVYIKTGLGYHTYNYPTVESFGDFYDIGEEFYGDIGLKISLINLGGFYILPEISIDTNGLLSYGLGFAF